MVADWPTVLPGFDAVLLVTGSADCPDYYDGLTDYSVAMHYWLFGLLFTKTAIVLHKTGRIIILTNVAAIKKHLQKFESKQIVLIPRCPPYSQTQNTLLSKAMMNILKGINGSHLLLGRMQNEMPDAALANAVFGVLPTRGITVSDCTEGISRMLQKKDNAELMIIQSSSQFAMEVIEKMKALVQKAIAENLTMTNAEVRTLDHNMFLLFF